MQVSKQDIEPLINATFPQYKGRKFRVEAKDKVTLYDLNWGGGSRNQYHAVTLDGRAVGNGEKFNQAAPWRNNAEGSTVDIPQGFAIVEHSIFCGKDVGITVYLNPADMPKYLTA